MPGRPPKKWFGACESAVAESGGAVDPGAVCGAEWQKKSESERRELTRASEGTAMRAKKRTHHKKSHPTKRHAKKSAHRAHAKRPHTAHKRKAAHHRKKSHETKKKRHAVAVKARHDAQFIKDMHRRAFRE